MPRIARRVPSCLGSSSVLSNRQKAGRKARRKGKDGELELSAFLREHGFSDARRGAQTRGGPDSPDVVGVPGCHLEAKRTESGTKTVYAWVDQAIGDAGPNIPIVCHRMSRRPWLAILRLDDLLGLVNGQAKS
jgi:hypothetical protein